MEPSTKKVVIIITVVVIILILIIIGYTLYVNSTPPVVPSGGSPYIPPAVPIPFKPNTPVPVVPKPPITPISPPVKKPSVTSLNPELNGYDWACKKTVGGSDSANIISRNRSGTIQCLGPGGANCYWFPNVSACQADFQKDLDSFKTNIFVCPTRDQTNPGHWCYQSRTDV